MKSTMDLSSKKILIAGAKGMLGNACVQVFKGQGARLIALGRDGLDVTDMASVRQVLEAERPGVIINCAAYTDVDGAEKERGLAMAVNASGPYNLAVMAKELGALLVHVSTDYVFDGNSDRPYREGDQKGPFNWYGITKSKGEDFVMDSGCEFLIVRTSWLFGGGGKNFVTTILSLARQMDELKVVHDQVGAPTYTVELARAIKRLVERKGRGVFHFSCSGSCSWYEFSKAILGLSGLGHKRVRPVKTHEFPRPAKRPAYSVLDTSKYQEFSGDVPCHWKECLRAYLKNLNEV